MEEGGDQAPAETPADNRSRVEQLLGGRPLMVYVVLAAGVLVLGILLAIVWFSATGGRKTPEPVCPSVSAKEAQSALVAGKVASVTVVVDPNHKDFPALIRFTTTDHKCFNGPQGPTSAEENYRLLGMIDFLNQNNDGSGPDIRRTWASEALPAEIYNTPTPTPTVAPTATVTPTPSPTPTPIPATPIPVPPKATPTPLPTATATATPMRAPASPRVASPVASPRPPGSPTAIASPATP